MGGARMASLWELWKRFDPVRSLADLLWHLFIFVTGLSVASMTAWAITTWNWYWSTFKWFGVAVAFLLALMAFALSVFLIGLGVRFWRQHEHATPIEARNDAASVAEPVEQRDTFYSPTVTQAPPSLEAGLYVADIRLTLRTLKKDRHSELTMRVFNGTGRVIEFVRLSGQIKFSVPNTADPNLKGELPEPSLRPDTAKSVGPLQEWSLILNQRVPAKEADKILALLRKEPAVNFDLSGLNIEIAARDEPTNVERLPLWDGVSYSRGYAIGRIISGKTNVTLGSIDTIG
jgi:hypothetical protein